MVVSVMNPSSAFQNVYFFSRLACPTERAGLAAHLHVLKNHGGVRIVFDHIDITTDGASQASTTAERTVLQGCSPVGTTPD